MRVFITGASGFIGSHTVRALLEGGHEVAALAFPDDPMGRLADLEGRYAVLRGDLAELPPVRAALADWRPEACIHLAWYAEPGKYLHSPENLPALANSLNLLQALIEMECRQVVMVGTCAEYDTDAGFLREEGPTRPETIYAATKLSLSLVGRQMAAAAGTRFAWGRVFYLYGPREDERRVVPALIRSLTRGQAFPATLGEQVRDYLHVADIAAGLRALVEQGADGIFNISSGVPVTMRQLMETAGEIVGRPELIRFGEVPYRDWEPPFICGDSRKLRALGWKPRYDLKEGLASVVEWWRRQDA